MGKLKENIQNALVFIGQPLLTIMRNPKPPKGKAVDMTKFELVFEDHFDGEKLNTDNWMPHYGGIRKGGLWDNDAQIFQKDSNLVIRTEFREDGRYGAGWYTGAIQVKPHLEQAFGYFECRCILPAARGLWSAFWLMPHNIEKGVPGREGTEIDIYESPFYYRKRKNDIVTMNLHYGGYGSGHRLKNVGIFRAMNPYSRFNTYALEWNETEYIFYINGRECTRSRFGGVSQVPEYAILSVEVDGADGKPSLGWSRTITENKNTAFPADFIVDYVRIYRYK